MNRALLARLAKGVAHRAPCFQSEQGALTAKPSPNQKRQVTSAPWGLTLHPEVNLLSDVVQALSNSQSMLAIDREIRLISPLKR